MSALHGNFSKLMLEISGMATRKIQLYGLQIEKKKYKEITEEVAEEN